MNRICNLEGKRKKDISKGKGSGISEDRSNDPVQFDRKRTEIISLNLNKIITIDRPNLEDRLRKSKDEEMRARDESIEG